MTVTCIGSRDRLYRGPYLNTTSQSKDWSRGLSPFYLGPVNLYVRNGRMLTARTVEQAWQNSKIYPQFDNNGQPSEDYWAWAHRGWNAMRVERYPMGKGAIPAYSWWDGKALNYIEARKKIYCPLYAEAVQKTKAWEILKQIYNDLGEIVLWDFDSHNFRAQNMSYRDVIHDESRPLGHSIVLAMLLEGDWFD